MSTFSSSPKVTFEDMSPRLPDTSARHTNMLPTSCGVGLLFVCRILCRVVDCQHVVEMSSFELEGAYVTHIPYVCFYIRTWVLAGKISVGCSQHKRPRHLKSCVGDTDPSGQNWSNILCRDDMSPTCQQHFQLRRGYRGKSPMKDLHYGNF
jgi:hypothetical protein